MIIYFSAPYKENRKIDVINDCQIGQITVPELHIHSLESIVTTAEIVDGIEKKLNILVGNMFQNYKGNFYEDYMRSGLPKTCYEFESFLFKTNWDSTYNTNTSIESLVVALENEFVLIERAYQTELELFNKATKRSSILKKKISGNLSEIALNTFVDTRLESEFLTEFFVVIDIQCEDKFFETINGNDRVCSDSLVVLAQDEFQKIYKFWGLKSAELQILKFLKKNEIKLKEFEDKSEFSQIGAELEDSADAPRRYQKFLESYTTITLGFYSSMKLFKLYLESLLIYGLPSKYDFYVIFANRTKTVIGNLVEFSENEGLRNVNYKNIKSLVEGENNVMIDFATVRISLPLFDD